MTVILRRFIFRFFLPLILGASIFAACSRSGETDSFCLLTARWNSASTQLANVLVNLESLPPGQIRETMSEVVASLIAINESSPREIKPDVELLLNTYGSLFDALQAIDWDGATSQKDAAVTSAGVRLASDEIQKSQTDFAKFVSENCSVEIENAVNQFPNEGTTLPDPVVKDDLLTEPPASFDNDETIPRAFGYVVVERFGVAITDEQADCVGTYLLAATASDASVVDLTYWQMLQTIFNSCRVQIDVAKALENE